MLARFVCWPLARCFLNVRDEQLPFKTQSSSRAALPFEDESTTQLLQSNGKGPHQSCMEISCPEGRGTSDSWSIFTASAEKSLKPGTALPWTPSTELPNGLWPSSPRQGHLFPPPAETSPQDRALACLGASRARAWHNTLAREHLPACVWACGGVRTCVCACVYGRGAKGSFILHISTCASPGG